MRKHSGASATLPIALVHAGARPYQGPGAPGRPERGPPRRPADRVAPDPRGAPRRRRGDRPRRVPGGSPLLQRRARGRPPARRARAALGLAHERGAAEVLRRGAGDPPGAPVPAGPRPPGPGGGRPSLAPSARSSSRASLASLRRTPRSPRPPRSDAATSNGRAAMPSVEGRWGPWCSTRAGRSRRPPPRAARR